MNTKLNNIQNWPDLAREAKWSASRLAKQCEVSVRTLERHFVKTIAKSPKAWLIEQRFKMASKLLCSGSTIKETANFTGYKHASTFSREFKKHYGKCPTMQQPFSRSSQLTNVA